MTIEKINSNRNRSDSRVFLGRLKRSIISWIRHKPILSGCMMLACVFLILIRLQTDIANHRTRKIEMDSLEQEANEQMQKQEANEQTQKQQAVLELARKTQSYNTNATRVALVMSKTRPDDLRWLRDYLETQPDNTPFIYSMDQDPESELLVPHSSRGREVSAYLSFVVDHYEELPAYSIFIHSNVDQWHNDLFGSRTSAVLENLRREAVDALGYVNLRCENNPGCPTHVSPFNPTEIDIANNDARANFPKIYKDIFGEHALVPEYIGGICCAQFAVSRERILQRPKNDYIRMMNWVNEKSLPYVDSYGVGWVFETLWHVVFGMSGTHCPRYEQCRCDNYGWCGPLPSGEILRAVTPKNRGTINSVG